MDEHLLQQQVADRYHFHDLIRVYAHECAVGDEDPAERLAAMSRMIGWYIHSVSNAGDQLHRRRVRWGMDTIPAQPTATTFADPHSALQWLLAEQANLTAAITYADQYLPGPEAWVLASQALSFFNHRALWSDMHDTHVTGLRCATRLGDDVGRTRMLCGIAFGLMRMGRYEEALAASFDYVEAAERTGDRRLIAAAIASHSDPLSRVGRIDEADETYQKAVAALREIGEPQPLASSLINLAMFLITEAPERIAEAEDRLREALRMLQTIDTPLTETYALFELARVRREQGDTDEAVTLLNRAIAIRARIGDPAGQASSLESLAEVLREAGREDEARAARESAEILSHETGATGRR